MIENYKQLPIGTYLAICDICKREDWEELDKQVEVLALLSGCTAEEIGRLPLPEYTERVAKADFLQRECEIPSASRLANEYRVGKWVLIPCIKASQLTASQYIDFQTYNKEGERKVVEMLSCFLVPKGHKYADGYDIAELQADIRKEMCVYDVLCVMAFFLVLLRLLTANSRTFLAEEIAKMTEKQRAELKARAQK